MRSLASWQTEMGKQGHRENNGNRVCLQLSITQPSSNWSTRKVCGNGSMYYIPSPRFLRGRQSSAFVCGKFCELCATYWISRHAN